MQLDDDRAAGNKKQRYGRNDRQERLICCYTAESESSNCSASCQLGARKLHAHSSKRGGEKVRLSPTQTGRAAHQAAAVISLSGGPACDGAFTYRRA